MSDIAGLIAKLEATGPDRELDRALWEIADHEAYHKAYWFARSSLSKGTPDDEKDAKARKAIRSAPPYTKLIDSALTLVPEGMVWHISNRGQIGSDGLAYAGVFGKPFVGSECDSHGATPAIAICIAALKARTARP